jgi:hypothetical protein
MTFSSTGGYSSSSCTNHEDNGSRRDSPPNDWRSGAARPRRSAATEGHVSCRVAPEDRSPGAPTDPDMRISRIRLVRSWVRCARSDCMRDARSWKRVAIQQHAHRSWSGAGSRTPRHPLAPQLTGKAPERVQSCEVPDDAVIVVVASQLQHRCLGRSQQGSEACRSRSEVRARPSSAACRASPSGRVYLDPQLQSRITDLVLQSQPHELCFVLTQSCGKPGRPLQAHRAPPVFNVTQMHPGHTEPLGKLRQTLALAFAQRR